MKSSVNICAFSFSSFCFFSYFWSMEEGYEGQNPQLTERAKQEEQLEIH
jgi:hypothetical protein